MEVFRRYRCDRTLLVAALLLVAVGLVMVFSASGTIANEKYHQPFHFLLQQIRGAALGCILLFVMLSSKRPFYERPIFICSLLILTLGLLGLCLFMPAVARVHRWVILFGFRFQPSELAKISLVLFLAFYCDRKKEKIQELSTVAVPLVIVGLSVFLILKEPDLGTAILVFSICGLVFYLGGVRLGVFAGLALASIPVFAYHILRTQYQIERIIGFASPGKNLQTINFQVAQSKLAIGSGGLLGVSLGESVQKLHFLPSAHTDFIFSIIGEELGFVGALAILVLFGLFVWRGYKISLAAPTALSRLASAGLTAMIGAQALLNMTVVLGLGPAKGVPLPFISFGRSSLVCDIFALGILLHISERREISRGPA
jgi:cell division protein FtsW